MIEKVGTIKNPLTIIAIFAAITEISGTVVLPFINDGNQTLYVWFLIAFPSLLIVIFFITLNFNNRVLYAPSDYQNEDNFLRSLPKATYAEKALKVEEEMAEDDIISETTLEAHKPGEGQPQGIDKRVEDRRSTASMIRSIASRSAQSRYLLVEEAIFKRLSKEYGNSIQRGVKLASKAGFIFDGIVRDKGVTTFIEVRLLRYPMIRLENISQALERIQEAAGYQALEQEGGFQVLLAVAVEGEDVSIERVASRIERIKANYSFPISFRYYKVDDLLGNLS
jgi:hypothetical protein